MKTLKVRDLKKLVAGIKPLYDSCEVTIRVFDEDGCPAPGGVGGLDQISIESECGNGKFFCAIDGSTERK